MKKMEQHILFFDIDGTLVSEKTGKIPESAKESIKRARENGHLLFLNTGRTLPQLSEKLLTLGFDGQVCGCGTLIRYKEEILFHQSLGKGLSREIAEDLERLCLDSILEGSKYIYHKRENELPFVESLKGSLNIKGGIRFFDDEDLEFDKLVVWNNPGGRFQPFHEKYKDTFQFIQREEAFYELVPLGHSKATGMEFLLQHLKLSKEHAVAVGDSTNDREMLMAVEKSIAMGNSNPVLFDLVDFVTRDVDEDGIAWGLRHYGLIP